MTTLTLVFLISLCLFHFTTESDQLFLPKRGANPPNPRKYPVGPGLPCQTETVQVPHFVDGDLYTCICRTTFFPSRWPPTQRRKRLWDCYKPEKFPEDKKQELKRKASLKEQEKHKETDTGGVGESSGGSSDNQGTKDTSVQKDKVAPKKKPLTRQDSPPKRPAVKDPGNGRKKVKPNDKSNSDTSH